MPNSALIPSAAARACLDDDHRSDLRQALRMRIIELGIRAIWGKSAFPVTMAADIPLISTGLRFGWLKALGALGVQQFVATSGLGFKFVCHTGDLAEYPFYHRRAFRNELAICAAWLHAGCEDTKPVVFDIGANVGTVCIPLVLQGVFERALAFEPEQRNFGYLARNIEQNGLSDRVQGFQVALSSASGELELEEGCLSVPGEYEKIRRAERITVRALDADGNAFTREATGLLAACIQHEMDHLEGKVFVERLSRLKQGRILARLRKQERQTAEPEARRLGF
jgi:hypothetical protein